MLDLVKHIYDLLPKRVFSFLRYVPDHILFGSRFEEASRRINTNRAIVAENLFSALSHARDNTMFWNRLIPKNLSKSDVFIVFDELPPISSDNLVNELDQFLSKKSSKLNSYRTTTGGTGRHPTTIVLSDENYAIEWAHMLYIWKQIGYARSKNVKLTLRGKTLKGQKFVEYNPVYNEVIVDMFKVTSSNFMEALAALRDYRIEFVHGYPSLVKEFMQYLRMHNAEYRVKGLMLGSEGASIEDKEEMREFFRCPVVSWYGQSERVILAADFKCDGAFTVLTSYGFASLYQPENGFGEICGTTFVNRALPLIKYRTGDYGCVTDAGENIVITDLRGRWGKDFVYLDRNKRIPTTSINIHGPAQSEVLYYQFYQKSYGKLTIRVLPKRTSAFSGDEIVRMLKEEMSEKLRDFEVNYVLAENERDIVRSERDKAILLVQDLEVT